MLEKMLLNFLLLYCAVFFGRVDCECVNYFKCLSDFVQEIFNDNRTNITNAVKIKNFSTNYIEITHIDNKTSTGILDDITRLLNGTSNETEIVKTYENVITVNNLTKIYIKTTKLNNKHTIKEEEGLDANSTVRLDNINNIESSVKEGLKLNSDNEQVVNSSVVKSNDTKENVTENIKENEIIKYDFDNYYTDDDNSTDYPIIDYVELYKDTTNEDIYATTEKTVGFAVNDLSDEIEKNDKEIEGIIERSLEMISILNTEDIKNKIFTSLYNVSEVVFPWISAIFIISDNNSRYDYFCDGALLSENVILTAARCVNIHGKTVEPNNILIILGKRSLQASGTDEKAVKVKEINIHENFTSDSDNPENDLAILILEERIQLSNSIQVARLPKPEEYNIADQAVTTGWNASGDLTLIYFEKKDIGPCDEANKVKNVFCATYDKEVKVCPSYGSLYVVQSKDTWYLHGVLTGDTTDRGICVDRSVDYTDLTNYIEWVWGIVNKHEI